MKIQAIEGVMRRRVLVNYRVIPEVMEKLLPPPFRPKLHFGWAMGGICMIRLEKMRPHGVPALLGRNSENAAHRFAVVWEDAEGKTQEGVYIPRRDTDSKVNRLVGGRLFPGQHHGAKFRVQDDGKKVDLEMVSEDGKTVVQVRGKATDELPAFSEFNDLAEASAFFEAGAVGYSPSRDGKRYEGIRLKPAIWQVQPLKVEHYYSTFFKDETKFPPQGVMFDCALIMRDVQHEWIGEPDMMVK